MNSFDARIDLAERLPGAEAPPLASRLRPRPPSRRSNRSRNAAARRRLGGASAGGRRPSRTAAAIRPASSSVRRGRAAPAARSRGRLQDQVAVHHEQRLRGDGRGRPVAVGHARVGEVEQLEHVVQVVADDRQVDRPAAAVVVGRVLRRVVEEVVAVLDRAAASRPSSGRACRRRPAARRGSPRPRAGGRLDPPEQPVLRVDLRGRRVVVAAHLVGAREHDQPVHRLDRPARPRRSGGPASRAARGWVGRLAERAEVVGRADQPLAEVPAPDAVDHHPAGQRVVRRRPASGPAPAGRSATAPNVGGVRRRRAPAGRAAGRRRPSVRWLPRMWIGTSATCPSATPIAEGISGAAFSSAASSSRSRLSSAFVSVGIERLGLLRQLEPSPPRGLGAARSPRRSAPRIASFFAATSPSWAALRARSCSVGQRVLVPPGDLLEGLHRPGALEDPGQAVVVGRAGSGRTCGRGSGRSRGSGPGTRGRPCRPARRRCPSPSSSRRPRPAPSARATRKPVAISRSCGRGRRRRRRAAGRRRAVRGRTGRRACRALNAAMT